MDKYTKKQPINKIKEGDSIEDIFVVKIKKSIRPYSRGYSFDLILTDSSGGSIEYKYWGGQSEQEVRELFEKIKADCVVLVTGKVSSYKNKLQIMGDSSSIIKVLEPGEYEAEFIMKAKRDLDEMYSELISKINSFENEELKRFLKDIFEKNIKDKFKKHPGAIQIHHNWIGGLIQHTLEVIDYCETAIKMYKELDRELLLSGAMLHDIGKLEEIETTSRIKGSKKGQLIGHLILGANYVSEKLKNYKLKEDFKDKLMHLIVSHHGKIENGSPKEPMIPEAVVLYYSDGLSSKTSEMIELINENKDKTEDDFIFSYRHNKNILLR